MPTNWEYWESDFNKWNQSVVQTGANILLQLPDENSWGLSLCWNLSLIFESMLSRSTQVHPTTTNIAQINPIHGLPTPSLAPILTCTYLKQLVETLASGCDCWQWHQLLCTESCSGSVAVVGRASWWEEAAGRPGRASIQPARGSCTDGYQALTGGQLHQSVECVLYSSSSFFSSCLHFSPHSHTLAHLILRIMELTLLGKGLILSVSSELCWFISGCSHYVNSLSAIVSIRQIFVMGGGHLVY